MRISHAPIEHRVLPDHVVGVSARVLDAVHYATQPGLAADERLARPSLSAGMPAARRRHAAEPLPGARTRGLA